MSLPPVFNTGPLLNPGSTGLTTFALCSELPSTSTQSPRQRMSYPARLERENKAKRLLLLGAFVYPTNVILMALPVAGVWRMVNRNAPTIMTTIAATNPQRLQTVRMAEPANDPATAGARRADCNRDGPPPVAAAHG